MDAAELAEALGNLPKGVFEIDGSLAIAIPFALLGAFASAFVLLFASDPSSRRSPGGACLGLVLAGCVTALAVAVPRLAERQAESRAQRAELCEAAFEKLDAERFPALARAALKGGCDRQTLEATLAATGNSMPDLEREKKSLRDRPWHL